MGKVSNLNCQYNIRAKIQISGIRGRVVEITEDGADEHIDKMAKKYLGVDKYPYRQPTEVRVIYKIQPEHTTMMG